MTKIKEVKDTGYNNHHKLPLSLISIKKLSYTQHTHPRSEV